jgi:putative ABC transport system permease protein
MHINDIFSTALSNLGRRRVRTALTSIGVVVGILTIVTMVSLGVGVQDAIRDQFALVGLENVIVRPREAQEEDFFTQYAQPQRQQPITPEVIAGWAQLPNVAAVIPSIDLEGVVTVLELPNGSLAPVEVTGLQFFNNPLRREAQALAGRLNLEAESGEVVLAAGALPGSIEPASVVGQQVTIVLQSPRGEQERFAVTVVGVSDLEDNEMQAGVEDMAAMKAWWFNSPDYLAKQGYDGAMVRAVDINAATQLVRSLRDDGYRVESLEIILDTANRAFAIINVMLASVGGLALFVASLGIVNTMIMAIYERTREIGTLKAIGASRGDIRNLFMIEAGLIGLLGGVVGVIGGWLTGLGLNVAINWYIEREQLPLQATFFVTPPWLALVALAFAALIGVLAGLYPAARAARLDPLVALRYE